VDFVKGRVSAPAMVVSFICGAVITGLLLSYFFVTKLGGTGMLPKVVKYAEMLSLLEDEYIGEADYGELDSAVYNSMITSLGDRWSFYISSDKLDEFNIYTHNQYTGIGVNIKTENGELVIVSVTAGSPAESAGLIPGDVIAAVDGTDVAGKEVSEVRDMILAKEGQEITLTVRSDGKAKDVTLKTGAVFKNPVSYEMLEGNIGYISITNFEDGSADEAISAISALEGDGAASFIFDVRGNPGGRLSELLKVLDYLLPEGELFVSRDKSGNETVETSGPECFEAPMAVLINADSYSAAEFFAAVLSEYGWAEIVGERSTGKARSQQTFEFSDGSAVHISTGAYLTPNRVDLVEAGGVVPDIEVELSPEEDSQLEAAADFLRENSGLEKAG
jgi:carboxyl-terminal processing protease